MSRMSIFKEVNAERHRQDEKWGGADHDDTHTLTTWMHIVRKYVAELTSYHRSRKTLIALIAVLVAWVEAEDRRTRR